MKKIILALCLTSLFISCGDKSTKTDIIEEEKDIKEVIKDEYEKEKLRLEKEKEDLLNKKEELKNEISEEIKAIDEGIIFKSFRGSQEQLQLELILFSQWTDLIQKGAHIDDKEINDLTKKFKAKVEKVQQKEFPILRKEYTKLAKDLMWEHNIDVAVSGSNNTIITFTGAMFADNKSNKDTQTTKIIVLL
ncbi:hypothetical protein, partial [Myroides odoratimimus]|uniref:hypothetical protein n=1 Tax=Myroides odoratimimus TaxID=76832 RepID=UPI0025750948